MKALDDQREILRKQMDAVYETLKEIGRLAGIEAEDTGTRRVGIIQRVVREHFRLPPACMSSKVKTNEYVECRQIAMHLCRELTNSTLESLARAFRKDMAHCTIITASDRVKEAMSQSKKYADQVEEIRAKCVTALDNSESPLFEYANSIRKNPNLALQSTTS